MAVITPQTDVYLLKCPLEISDINQLTFANATAQYNYFSSLPKLPVDNFTYQRKDGTIRYGANFDSLINYNYVMYRNDAFSNKWFYAFITGMEYLNDNVTAISIKTDVWQSYQFDLTFKPVLIDREHTNDDTVGANTYPEGLELGEMVCNGDVVNFGGASNYCIVVEVSQIENTGSNQTLSYEWVTGETQVNITPVLNNIGRGTTPLICEDFAYLKKLRSVYDIAGLADSIINMYMFPKASVGTTHKINLTATNTSTTEIAGPFGIPEHKDGVYDLGTSTFTRASTISSYVPKNNKLFCWPYNYFNLSNNAGTSIPYHYEDFSGNISFKVESTFGVSGSTKAIPQNYKFITSSENALDYSINGPKYPVCSWKSDSYTNWLTQNGVNMETQWKTTIVSAIADVAGGMLTGSTFGAAGAIMGTVGGSIAATKSIIETAKGQMLAKTSANLTPDQAKGNLGAGDFVWAKYRSPFTFIPMSIKPEYARQIDEFFSEFGYKCNRVKVPNITGRRNWNYVKTVGCYIEANIPQDDLAEIKSMFDKGITLWHNPATFADYSQTNDII